jgi:hypothetical protein
VRIASRFVTSPARQAANAVEPLERVELRRRRAGAAYHGGRGGELRVRRALRSCPVLHATSRVAASSTSAAGFHLQIAVASTRGDAGSLRCRSDRYRLDAADAAVLPGRPARPEALARARAEVDRLPEGIEPPPVEGVLAVGGSARALKRITAAPGSTGTGSSLPRRLARTPVAEVAFVLRAAARSAAALTAGAVILQAITDRLGAGPGRARWRRARRGAASPSAGSRVISPPPCPVAPAAVTGR